MIHRTTTWTVRPRVARIGIVPSPNQIQRDARATTNRAALPTDAWITEDQWCAGFPAQQIENAGLCWWRHS